MPNYCYMGNCMLTILTIEEMHLIFLWFSRNHLYFKGLDKSSLSCTTRNFNAEKWYEFKHNFVLPKIKISMIMVKNTALCTLLLTWFNFNPSMDK